MSYKVGIDVGSTTLKVIILNTQNEIVYKSYERHKSKVRGMTIKKFNELKSLLKDKQIQIAITGSAGMGISKDAQLPFVQEVFASAQAIKTYYPMTDVMIELGGEDAKIIFFKGAIEERMNSSCAGGTGAFIDQMAALLHVDLQTLDTLSQSHTTIYPIASRCGVFAKSDIQPLINQGVDKSNLAASIFQAVVDQCIAGLAQGRTIEGNVLFLGGPLHFLKGLQQRFKESLHLQEEETIFPELSPYFVALGSAIYAQNEQTYTYEEITSHLHLMQQQAIYHEGLNPLFETNDDIVQFQKRHRKASAIYQDIKTYQGNAYLGIDSGSTTTKIILIDDQERILFESYANNEGNPIDVIRKELLKLYELMGNRIQIQYSAVTGYGEDLIKHAFQLDYGLVETMAHYHAAKHFHPDVDFIIDIGGQDMKCFRIKDHTIDDILLNEACSSGCGSFIETFAHSMGYDIQTFANLGMQAKHPVDLGTRCTVFMNSSVKQAQKNGAAIEDISAGLCVSVVKNALYKVIRANSINDLGQHIVVQGGTFLNDTILRSFELTLNRNVIRPTIAHLMGAFGAALFAKQLSKNTSTILSKQQLLDFQHQTKATTCGLCTNRCSLTVNIFTDGSRFIAGNKCERPTLGTQYHHALPNLYTYKYQQLRSLKSNQGVRGKIGIPLVLNMYDTLPLWHTFFTHLQFEVVISDASSKALYRKGQHTIPSDTACYPAKLVHGHIISLLEKQVGTIFYPCMTYHMDDQISDQHYNCPVVAYYPELIGANIDMKDTMFLQPYLYLDNKQTLAKQLLACLQTIYKDLTMQEITLALEYAFQAYYQYQLDIQEEGKKALAYAKQHHLPTIVLAGRPYHVDPQINHGLHQLLTQLQFVVLSEDSILKTTPFTTNVLNQWSFHARMYQAAAFVKTQPHMELIHLVSFGCGIDAITSDEIKGMLRQHGKLYTQIKIDEVDNLGAIKIRCRSLKAAMEEREANIWKK